NTQARASLAKLKTATPDALLRTRKIESPAPSFAISRPRPADWGSRTFARRHAFFENDFTAVSARLSGKALTALELLHRLHLCPGSLGPCCHHGRECDRDKRRNNGSHQDLAWSLRRAIAESWCRKGSGGSGLSLRFDDPDSAGELYIE